MPKESGAVLNSRQSNSNNFQAEKLPRVEKIEKDKREKEQKKVTFESLLEEKNKIEKEAEVIRDSYLDLLKKLVVLDAETANKYQQKAENIYQVFQKELEQTASGFFDVEKVSNLKKLLQETKQQYDSVGDDKVLKSKLLANLIDLESRIEKEEQSAVRSSRLDMGDISFYDKYFQKITADVENGEKEKQQGDVIIDKPKKKKSASRKNKLSKKYEEVVSTNIEDPQENKATKDLPIATVENEEKENIDEAERVRKSLEELAIREQKERKNSLRIPNGDWGLFNGLAVNVESYNIDEEKYTVFDPETNKKNQISFDDLQKIEENLTESWQEINQASSEELFLEAIRKTKFLKTENGSLYRTEVIAKAVELAFDSNAEANSKFVRSLPDIPVIKEKVINFLRKRVLETARQEYLKHNVVFSKDFGGFFAKIDIALGNDKYFKEEKAKNEKLYKNFCQARAEYVSDSLDLALEQEVALADSRAEVFISRQGWGKKFFDKLKSAPHVRTVINASLLGIGFAMPHVALPLFGIQKVIGGAMAYSGTFDRLNQLADQKNSLQIGLNKSDKKVLDSFIKEEGRGFFDSKKPEGYEQKKEELLLNRAKEEATKMSTAQLEKLLAYFSGTMAMRGKKMTDNPVYMELLKEKYRRLREAIPQDFSKDAKNFKDSKRLSEADPGRTERLKKEKIIILKEQLIAYLKLSAFVNGKLFEAVVDAYRGSDDEKKAQVYKNWDSSKKRAQQMYNQFPSEMQLFIMKKVGKEADLKISQVEGFLNGALPRIEGGIDWDSFLDKDFKLEENLENDLTKALEDSKEIEREITEKSASEIMEEKEFIDESLRILERKREEVRRKLAELLADADSELLKEERKDVSRKQVRQMLALGLGVAVGAGVAKEFLLGSAVLLAPRMKLNLREWISKLKNKRKEKEIEEYNDDFDISDDLKTENFEIKEVEWEPAPFVGRENKDWERDNSSNEKVENTSWGWFEVESEIQEDMEGLRERENNLLARGIVIDNYKEILRDLYRNGKIEDLELAESIVMARGEELLRLRSKYFSTGEVKEKNDLYEKIYNLTENSNKILGNIFRYFEP